MEKSPLANTAFVGSEPHAGDFCQDRPAMTGSMKQKGWKSAPAGFGDENAISVACECGLRMITASMRFPACQGRFKNPLGSS
jgi:hypothetical protein